MFILKFLLFIIGCGLTVLSVCIKFDKLEVKRYKDPENHKEKEDMCYNLLIAALAFLLLLLFWIIIEETILLGERGYQYGKTQAIASKNLSQQKYNAAKNYGQQKYNAAKNYGQQKYKQFTGPNPPKVAYIQE
jgi:hypothetical protein